MYKINIIILFSIIILSCTPKGPQTFNSPFINKTETELFNAKGAPTEIKHFGDNYAYIYRHKEEYYGKSKDALNSSPKKTYFIEFIYYIDNQKNIYKYQVWKKRID